MNTTDKIIYAAGFFDGEGSVSIGKPGKASGYRLIVKATQKRHTKPLERLQELWGGSLWLDTRYEVWQWQVCGDAAMVALEDMLPYLMVKGQRAKIGIRFQQRRGRRHEYDDKKQKQDERDYERMAVLNQRGTVN